MWLFEHGMVMLEIKSSSRAKGSKTTVFGRPPSRPKESVLPPVDRPETESLVITVGRLPPIETKVTIVGRLDRLHPIDLPVDRSAAY